MEEVFAGVRRGDQRVPQLAEVRRRQRQHSRHGSAGAGGARSARVPVRHVLFRRSTGAEEHRRPWVVQPDGGLVGLVLYDRFDRVENKRIEISFMNEYRE